MKRYLLLIIMGFLFFSQPVCFAKEGSSLFSEGYHHLPHRQRGTY